jgi:hypothetical protein
LFKAPFVKKVILLFLVEYFGTFVKQFLAMHI